MSVLAWLAWRKHPSRQLLSVVALCAGIAVSFELTVFPLVVAWVFTIALELWIRRASWSEILKPLIIFGVIAVAPICLWFLRNLVVTGNPVYPLLANFIETRDWSIEQTEILSRFMHYYTWGVASGAQLSEYTRKAMVMATALLVVGAGGDTCLANARYHLAHHAFVHDNLHCALRSFDGTVVPLLVLWNCLLHARRSNSP